MNKLLRKVINDSCGAFIRTSGHTMEKIPLKEYILQQYAAGRRSFTGMDLEEVEGLNFDNTDLSGSDFSGSCIVVSFKNSNMENCLFNSCNLKTCDFSGANLMNASFTESSIDATIFKAANVSGATFEGACEQGHIYTANQLPFDI